MPPENSDSLNWRRGFHEVSYYLSYIYAYSTHKYPDVSLCIDVHTHVHTFTVCFKQLSLAYDSLNLAFDFAMCRQLIGLAGQSLIFLLPTLRTHINISMRTHVCVFANFFHYEDIGIGKCSLTTTDHNTFYVTNSLEEIRIFVFTNNSRQTFSTLKASATNHTNEPTSTQASRSMNTVINIKQTDDNRQTNVLLIRIQQIYE